MLGLTNKKSMKYDGALSYGRFMAVKKIKYRAQDLLMKWLIGVSWLIYFAIVLTIVGLLLKIPNILYVFGYSLFFIGIPILIGSFLMGLNRLKSWFHSQIEKHNR